MASVAFDLRWLVRLVIFLADAFDVLPAVTLADAGGAVAGGVLSLGGSLDRGGLQPSSLLTLSLTPSQQDRYWRAVGVAAGTHR